MPSLNFLTNAINAVLLILVTAAPVIFRHPGSFFPFWLRSAAGLGLAVGLAESGKYFVVWPGHPSFPSGHETFALSLATSLVIWDRRWLALALPLAALQAWVLIIAHFHQPPDVVGSLFVGPPCALLCHFWKRRNLALQWPEQ